MTEFWDFAHTLRSINLGAEIDPTALNMQDDGRAMFTPMGNSSKLERKGELPLQTIKKKRLTTIFFYAILSLLEQ